MMPWAPRQPGIWPPMQTQMPPPMSWGFLLTGSHTHQDCPHTHQDQYVKLICFASLFASLFKQILENMHVYVAVYVYV
jgi:hypothetical protein